VEVAPRVTGPFSPEGPHRGHSAFFDMPEFPSQGVDRGRARGLFASPVPLFTRSERCRPATRLPTKLPSSPEPLSLTREPPLQDSGHCCRLRHSRFDRRFANVSVGAPVRTSYQRSADRRLRPNPGSPRSPAPRCRRFVRWEHEQAAGPLVQLYPQRRALQPFAPLLLAQSVLRT
jgi:hypothetical protein